MTAPAAFQLGDRVAIRGTAHKIHSDTRTIYVAADGPPFDRAGPGRGREYPEGIVIGKRALLTGKTRYVGEPVFRADGSVTVYVVAYSLHRKPAYCFPEQIEVIP